MYLTPKELDRLTVFTLAELARRYRARGIKLNYAEAAALICDEVFQEALARASDPAAKLDTALDVVLRLFTAHRALARLFLVEALAAGPAIQRALVDVRRRFAGLIARELIAAREAGVIGPIDPDLAATACFGALYEVVTQWVLTGQPADLEQAAPELRRLLRRMIGIPDSGREDDART